MNIRFDTIKTCASNGNSRGIYYGHTRPTLRRGRIEAGIPVTRLVSESQVVALDSLPPDF